MFHLKLLIMVLWSMLISLVLLPFFWLPNAFPRWVRTLSRGVLAIAGIRAEMENKHYLEAVRPCVIMGNHQSALDFVTFGSYMPNACTGVGKKEIAYLPIVGWTYALSGGFLLDRKNRDRAVGLLSQVADHLKEKQLAVGIMPEGTRNLEGRGLLPFKKGAFHLAIEAQADIVVCVSAPLADIANFGTRTLKRGTIPILAHPPISVQGKTEADIDALMEQVRAIMLADLDRLKVKLA